MLAPDSNTFSLNPNKPIENVGEPYVSDRRQLAMMTTPGCDFRAYKALHLLSRGTRSLHRAPLPRPPPAEPTLFISTYQRQNQSGTASSILSFKRLLLSRLSKVFYSEPAFFDDSKTMPIIGISHAIEGNSLCEWAPFLSRSSRQQRFTGYAIFTRRHGFLLVPPSDQSQTGHKNSKTVFKRFWPEDTQ